MTVPLKGPKSVLFIGMTALATAGCSSDDPAGPAPVPTPTDAGFAEDGGAPDASGPETLSVVIESPTSGSSVQVEGTSLTVTGEATSNGVVSSVVVNGEAAVFTESVPAGGIKFSASVPVTAAGAFTATAIARTRSSLTASTSATVDVQLTGDRTAPVVTITSPVSGTVTTAAQVVITGNVSEPSSVTIAGQQIVGQVSNFSETVSLNEGANTILVSAVDANGNIGSGQVAVIRDTTPPKVTVLFPQQNADVFDSTVSVIGTVIDSRAGDVNVADCQVFVNGAAATVSGNSFVANNIPIGAGASNVTVLAIDGAGNSVTENLAVTNRAVTNTLRVVSGNGQSATVGSTLAAPLQIEVTDQAGAPVRTFLDFTVVKGDGTLDGGARLLEAVRTDATGRASASFTVGTTAGIANNVVTAQTGDGQTVTFTAGAVADVSRPVLVALSGGDTSAAVGSILAAPLIAQVTDSFGNALPGRSVTFNVATGDATINGTPQSSVLTDADGRALARVEFPASASPGTVVITATTSGTPSAAYFPIKTLMPSATGETTISGIVVSEVNAAIAGATVSVRGVASTVTTGANGDFSITLGNLSGKVFLTIDGFTPGFSDTTVEVVTVQGVDNPLSDVVSLATLDTLGSATTSTVSVVEITRDDLPGFSLRIPAGSATFADGSKIGEIRVLNVNSDALPTFPPNGTTPSSIISIRPASVAFDPPAELRLPNADGRAAGTVLTLFVFGDQSTEFVGTGTGQVTDDRLVIQTERGQGVGGGGMHLYGLEPIEPAQCVSGSLDACARLTCECNNDVLNCSFGTRPSGGAVPSPDDGCYVQIGAAESCDPTNPITSCAAFLQPVPADLLGSPCTRRTWSQCPPTEEAGICVSAGANAAVCCPTTNYCDGNGAPQNCTGNHPICCATACDANDCCPAG